MRSRAREHALEEEVQARKPALEPDVRLTGAAARARGGPDVRDVLGLQRGAGNQAVARMLSQTRQRQLQRVLCGTIDVLSEGGLPTWEWGGEKFHFNMKNTGAFHITNEYTREHYYFKVDDFSGHIEGMTPVKQQKKELKKRERKETRKRFEELDPAHQMWFRTHYRTILHA
jgi:hypothetical protein